VAPPDKGPARGHLKTRLEIVLNTHERLAPTLRTRMLGVRGRDIIDSRGLVVERDVRGRSDR
jgi:hypothetical protein